MPLGNLKPLLKNIFVGLSIMLLSILFNSPIFGQSTELIFHSGFEPGSTDTTNGIAADIFGVDLSVSPPNDWINDLDFHTNIGNFSIQFQGGDDNMRWARIINDPTDSTNKTLSYWLKYPNVGGAKGRVQANIYGNNNLYEIYQKVRLYLPNDWNIIKTVPATVTWLTIMEFWNNLPAQDSIYPFRITLGIHKRDSNSQKLTFNVDGQIMPDPPPWPRIWEESDTSFSVPLETWMTLEIYFKEGDASNGRFFLAVTPDGGSRKVIFDVTNYTHHPSDPSPDGLVRYNPMKLYTSKGLIDYVRNSGGVLQVYWDDFELWKDTSLITAIFENEAVNSYKIYPNPTSNKATLEFNNNRQDIYSLILYDSHGRLVRTISNINTNQVIIEKDNLDHGLYFFRLFSDKQAIAMGKLIIQ